MARALNWTRLTSAAELALDRTLTCGQSFTWTRLPSGIWCNTLPGHAGPVLLRTHNDEVQFRYLDNPCSSLTQPVPKSPPPPPQYLTPAASPVDPASNSTHDPVYLLLHDYFQLSYSLPTLYLDWNTRDSSHFARIAPMVPGIRLLRQPPIETLFAFICSANNNIARITGMVQALSKRYGECVYPGGPPADCDSHEVLPPMYAFPTVDQLMRNAHILEAELRSLGFGYRARYIAATVKMLDELGGEAWLLELRGKGYVEVRDALLQLQGVGRKVADCVALMSLDQPGAIPVDTHVWQIATRDYKFKPSTKSKTLTPTTYDEVVKLFQTIFGPEAGWAHSVLFTADLARTAASLGTKTRGKTLGSKATDAAAIDGRFSDDDSLEQSTASPAIVDAPTVPRRKRKASAKVTAATSTVARSMMFSADVSPDNIVTSKRRRRQKVE